MTGSAAGNLERCAWYSLLVGIAGSLVCVIGALIDSDQFLRAYLYSYFFLLGLSIGGLALVMIHNLTGGAWGILVRRFAEAQMKLLPLMVLLALPVTFGLPHVYTWVRAVSANTRAEAAHLFWPHYLQPPFFFVRAAVYFAIWLLLVSLMNVSSRWQDDSPNAQGIWRAYKASGFGLVLLGVSLHFAVMDWFMSLQAGFTSTMLGPLVFSSQVLSSFAVCVIVFCCLLERPEYVRLLSSKVMNDLGSLLFTMLTLWAYLAWSQFMLIWMADLPHGNMWYLARWRVVGAPVVAVLILFQFVVPFFALLFRAVKQNRQALRAIATLVFVGQWVFMYYVVVPLFGANGWSQHWIDFVTPPALGGIWFGGFSWLLTRRTLVPVYDLNYEQAAHLREIDFEEMARDEAVAR